MPIFGSLGHLHRLVVTGLQVAGMPKKKGSGDVLFYLYKNCQSQETPPREAKEEATVCWNVWS